jgi:hypothetical protein
MHWGLVVVVVSWGRIEWMYLDCCFSFGTGVARLILVQYSIIIPLFVLL